MSESEKTTVETAAAAEVAAPSPAPASALAVDAASTTSASSTEAPVKKEIKLNASVKEFVPRGSAPEFVPKTMQQPGGMMPIPQGGPMHGGRGGKGGYNDGYYQVPPQYQNVPMGYPMGMMGPPMGYAPYPYPQYPPNMMSFPQSGYPTHHGHGGGGRGKYSHDGRDNRRMGSGPSNGDNNSGGRPSAEEGVEEVGELRFGKFAPSEKDEGVDQKEKTNGQIGATGGSETSVPDSGNSSEPATSSASAATAPARAPVSAGVPAPAPTTWRAVASAPAAAIAATPAPAASTAAPVSAPAPSPAPTPAPVPTFAEKVAASMNAQSQPSVGSGGGTRTPAPAQTPATAPATAPAPDNEKQKRGFGGGTDSGGEWSRSTQREVAVPAFGSARNGSNSSPTSATAGGGGGGGGWKRGEAIHAEPLLQRDDGIKRYDKATLMSLWTPKKACPDSIKDLYLALAKIERQPVISKGVKLSRTKSGLQLNEEPHPDEQVIFVPKEGTFRYQPSRLSDTTDPSVILSKANLILNKLSVTKFDKLSDEFMAVGLDSEDLMGKAVEMIVLKAQVEEHFCFMYADLCRKITDEWSSGSEENEESLGKSFRVKLLEFCRDQYGRDRTGELEEIRNSDCTPEEKDEKELIIKKRYVGTMRFIGEIYMKQLVNSTVMQNCVNELLEKPEEENLVCMCKLLRTIGAKLQNNDTKKKTDKVGEYFEAISKMSVEHASSRMRFMLKDLVDLRKAGWVERRETEKAVKLSDLRSEESVHGSKGGHSRSASSSNMGAKSQDARQRAEAPSADEWQTIPVSKTKSKSGASAFGAKEKTPGFGGAKSSGATMNNSFSVFGKQSGPKVREASTKDKSGKDAKTRPDRKVSSSDNSSSASAFVRTGSPAFSDDVNDEDAVTLERTVSFGASENGDGSERGESPRGRGEAGMGGASIDKQTIEQVKKSISSYFVSVDVDDITCSIQDIIHPDGMGDILKPSIQMAFDKRDVDRENLVKLFVYMYSKGVLRTEQVARGLGAFLDDLDELAIDVPMAATYGANMLATLVVEEVINLSFLTQLHEEHNFLTSPRAASFIAHTLSAIAKRTDMENAEAIYKGSGLEIKSFVVPAPKGTVEDALKELVAKTGVTFIA